MEQVNKDNLHKLLSIFLPKASAKIDKLESKKDRLVHYTSSENALNIIKSKELWLRNVRTMNDWSEVEHGFNLLKTYFSKSHRKVNKLIAFKNALDNIHAGVGDEVINTFDSFYFKTYSETYISCLSHHLNHEDIDGRLSMWRAYSSDSSGAAIILKTPPRNSANPLNVLLHPVAYADDKYVEKELNQVIRTIKSEVNFLKTQSKENIFRFAYISLIMSVVSLKHKGFKEEQEWRLIHSPSTFGSDFVKVTTHAIRGIPQKVYKLGLQNFPEKEVNNIAFHELFDSIILTPSPYNISIIGALEQELINAGVSDLKGKIRISTIPYRKN